MQMPSNNLGSCYLNGRGVTRMEPKAIKWYQKAAAQGLPHSQFTLGELFARGIGVRKDSKEAAEWYRKAAEQGHLQAQVNLGELDYFGAGDFPKNQVEAATWLTKAAAREMFGRKIPSASFTSTVSEWQRMQSKPPNGTGKLRTRATRKP